MHISPVICHFHLGIGFTECLSIVIIGHWSREQNLMREHFNFCDEATRHNVIEFDSGNSNPCDQKHIPVKGLLSKLVSILTRNNASSNSSAILPVVGAE